MGTASLAWCFAALLLAAEDPVRSDRPNAVTFAARQAKFVRFVIHKSSSGEPCIDELEVYGPEGTQNLALAGHGAKATASSCLVGYAIHQIAHLNDGRYGNPSSWIAARAEGEWAQIELPAAAAISQVVFSRDRQRQYADRVPIHFEVQLSLDGRRWQRAKEVLTTAAPVAVGPRYGEFAGTVPAAPPPPKLTESGAIVLAGEPHDPKVAEKDELGFMNLALGPGAKAAASSLLPGHAIHQIEHLNDGLAGNRHSWISRGEPSWAEIDLGDVHWVYRVAFGSDRSGQYNDRAATAFSILTATEHDEQSDAPSWRAVYRQEGGPPVHARQAFTFRPVQARWVRVALAASSETQVRIDEIEVFGQKDPIRPERIGPIPEPGRAESAPDPAAPLREAFLAEEHAWLKTFGRADLSPRLVPYNGRVREYPRHVGDDRLPLPPLSSGPKLDGRLDDPCWQAASRGVVRVAHPLHFDDGPLASCAVTAGRYDGDLLLAIQTDQLLSSHLAVVSAGDGRGCGVVACTKQGLVFNRYVPEGRGGAKLEQSTPVEGALDRSLACCELRLPLDWFPDCRQRGLRVGLGMGGKHTRNEGRAVHFVFSPLAIAELPPCVDRTFRVRLSVAPGAEAVAVRGGAPGLADGLRLAPGESTIISIPADEGPIGPELGLSIDDDRGESYALNLFRYDPLQRTLDLMEAMVDRFAAKGLDVREERDRLAELRRRHEALSTAQPPDPSAEREAFFQARLAKRRLFFRDPDLALLARILCVKRRPFEPSHNYSDCFDAPFRPGGGVYVVHVPRIDGRFEPGRAEAVRLFDSGGGIARNPAADFALGKVYFGYRPSEDGYYHLMRMNADGSGLTQLTDGPFHDYWPCPLPDGGIALISSRCTCRALCWRPQALTLFRMDADGGNLRPLSRANLTEWAPSVAGDGRILWTRWEYLDKGADFGHTLWSIRPDGTHPELVFGNTIIQPNGYVNAREVPGTSEICCTLISHFGDLNGPIALVDLHQGRFNPKAIRSITPEVPWPGMWPREECFRDPVPLARDYFLCSHAPGKRFELYVIDRFGNRELVYMDPAISTMCPTLFVKREPPPVLAGDLKFPGDRPPPEEREEEGGVGELFLADVYRGLSPTVQRGRVKYLRVVEEVRSGLDLLPSGEYRKDHPVFQDWYATPVHKVSGPYGWPAYVAKAPWGIVPVEEDGSAHFCAPAGRTLYFQALDEDFNELQRMRSVVQLQPGEKRSCIGCHEDRRMAPPDVRPMMAGGPRRLQPPPWGAGAFSYERVVQPIWDARCTGCHDARDERKLDLTGTLDGDKVPASYRTLISQGWVHYCDCGYNSGGCEKLPPLSFGTVKSRLWEVLDAGHYEVKLSEAEQRAVKCWTDLNCPLWPDYMDRTLRPGPELQAGAGD